MARRAYEIKPIETEYNGVLFRSALEARYAIIFDLLDINWVYEPEGYKLPTGWYLPDFYIPKWRTYIEIKPTPLISREANLLHELNEHNSHWFTYGFIGTIGGTIDICGGYSNAVCKQIVGQLLLNPEYLVSIKQIPKMHGFWTLVIDMMMELYKQDGNFDFITVAKALCDKYRYTPDDILPSLLESINLCVNDYEITNMICKYVYLGKDNDRPIFLDGVTEDDTQAAISIAANYRFYEPVKVR